METYGFARQVDEDKIIVIGFEPSQLNMVLKLGYRRIHAWEQGRSYTPGNQGHGPGRSKHSVLLFIKISVLA
jgi:hypothetical protein